MIIMLNNSIALNNDQPRNVQLVSLTIFNKSYSLFMIK